uniref:Uncharacterized protein n=1 Tax=Hyaloperonospora arabidopsidis (strain Emoy2) TaxID=559515 RepID=M4BFJ8_HYAAE
MLVLLSLTHTSRNNYSYENTPEHWKSCSCIKMHNLRRTKCLSGGSHTDGHLKYHPHWP